MRLPYDERLLQGESLFQDRWRRKIQFFWANEGMVTAERDDGVKMSWSPLDKRCRVVSLRQDPDEKKPQPCDGHPELLGILKWFRDDQLARLPAYSEAARTGRAFHGL
jgi:hypothetical protein